MQRKGLEGLKGIDFNSQEVKDWIARNKKAGVITDDWRPSDIENLYKNRQFINKYGKDEFRRMRSDPEARYERYRTDIINEAFEQNFSPLVDVTDENGTIKQLVDPNKGLGNDYFTKYNLMDTDSKLALLQSNYLTPSEFKDKQEKDKKLIEDVKKHSLFKDVFEEPSPTESEVSNTLLKGKNDKILEKIYSKSLKGQTDNLVPVVNEVKDAYFSPSVKDDTQIRKEFALARKNEGGPAYIYSVYFNDKGESTEDETKQFSIDDMRDFLAKKMVYDQYLGPEAGYDALNNEAKTFINEHQSVGTYLSLLAKDIAISTASYAADGYNSIRRLSLLGQDSDVYVTNDNEVVPTKDIKDGKYVKDGVEIPVHKVKLSLLALDDMGKDENGEDRSWINNQQFWTNAEQFGTLDEEELAQYKKLGYSPYKVVYKPGDETDYLYEAAKMTSFALADMAITFLPVGVGATGTKMVGKAAEMTGKLAKATEVIGKGLQYTGKLGQGTHPFVAASAIGSAYGRGVYGETLANNMQKIDQSIYEKAQEELGNNYNSDKGFRDYIDSRIEFEYQQLKKQQEDEIAASEGQRQILDEQANEDVLRAKAMQNVIQDETDIFVNNFKNSDNYAKALQEASESATDAAFITALTTTAKYGVVNQMGFRKWRYKSPKQLVESYKKSGVKGVTEEVTSAGKSRLKAKYNFKTLGQKAKQLGKTVASQGWGGAWTNATDELQSGGGRRYNEDRISQFIGGMYTPEALDSHYSILDGVSSYLRGAAATIGTENPYRAGLVGFLGSLTSLAPNISGILTTPKFKQRWKNASFGERVNMLVTNGILSDYYAKKQSQQELQFKVTYINELLDKTNDFESMQQIMALDLASMDVENPEDAKAIAAMKSVQEISLLNQILQDQDLAQTGAQSSVVRNAVDRLNVIQEIANDKASEETMNNQLALYYKDNPSIAQSPEQNEIAKQEIKQRATDLVEASKIYDDIQNKISQVEESKGIEVPPIVKQKLTQRLTFNDFLKNRISQLENNITGSSEITKTSSDISTYGTKTHQEAKIKDNEKLISDIEKEISKAQETVDKTKTELDQYQKETLEEDKIPETEKALVNKYDNARIQLEYLNNIKRGLSVELENLNKQGISDRVLTTDEILHLNPEDRARMLDGRNYNNYSDAQKAEISKLKNQLLSQSPTILEDIQNQANLVQKNRVNQQSLALILENPIAAAYQLESDRAKQESQASQLHLNKVTTNIVNNSMQILDKGKLDNDEAGARQTIYNNLRVLNRNLLNHLKDNLQELGISDIEAELDHAIEWSDITTDISQITDQFEIGHNRKTLFLDNFQNVILDTSSTKQEILDKIGNIVESPDVDDSIKVLYEELLQNLEQTWDQKSSTTTMTREERERLQEEKQKKLEEEKKRLREAEEQARLKAEEEAKQKEIKESKEKEEQPKQEVKEQEVKEEQPSIQEPKKEVMESPSLEEQVAKADNAELIEVPSEDINADQEILPESDGTLLGNVMYGYDFNSLNEKGVLIERTGKDPNDSMSQYFNWLKAAGIQLQEIIDNELSDIQKTDPKVYPLYVRNTNNATNDSAMKNFVLLAVEYTNDIDRIHKKERGGVITSNDKQYLIIGTAGFVNKSQQPSISRLVNNRRKTEFFKNNQTERFFVDTDQHTKIKDISGGNKVRRLTTDAEVNPNRSVLDLLNDPQRNPEDLSIEDLKWLIQYENKAAVINVSSRNVVFSLRDVEDNVGNTFVLVKAANGKYIPMYIKPQRYTEMKDGALKDKINTLLNELTSTKYNERYIALAELLGHISLTIKDINILIGTEDKPTVTITKGNEIYRTFNVASPTFNRMDLFRAIQEVNPRVNLTTTNLSNKQSIQDLAEAGALNTDIAKLGTSNASFTVYDIGAEGNPIIRESSPAQTTFERVNSELQIKQRKLDSSVQHLSKIYRKDSKDTWWDENDRVVTDPRLIEQLNYSNLIRSRNLIANDIVGLDEIFIVNSDPNNPLVLVRRNKNVVTPLTKEGALKQIDRINKKRAEEVRQKRIQEEAKKLQEQERRQEEILKNASEEQKQKAAKEGEDVDLDLGPELLTPQQIADQENGNFYTEPTSIESTEQKEKEQLQQPEEKPKATQNVENTTKSLQELQEKKQATTALDIIKSRELGSRARKLLKQKYPDLPSSISKLEKFLQSKGITTTGIIDADAWLKEIEECK